MSAKPVIKFQAKFLKPETWNLKPVPNTDYRLLMTDYFKFIIVLITIYSCIFPWTLHADDEFNQVLKQVREEVAPLNLENPYVPSSDEIQYFKYYGLQTEEISHTFGYFDSGGFRIVSHVFQPEKPRGTVYLLHGYLDHTGIMSNLIRFLLSGDFAVAVYDLPGHGLSSGKQASIDDFSQYLGVFRDFVKLTSPHLPEPVNLICHSTGCSIALDYMYGTDDPVLDKIILLAPMVHSAHWGWSRFGVAVADPFVDSVPRDFRENSSDPVFLEFIREDPLQSRSVSFPWLRALYEWEKRVKLYGKTDLPVMILQGTDDRILDWEYNLGFLKKVLERAKIKVIAGADHQLVNESPELREKVFLEIGEYLKK